MNLLTLKEVDKEWIIEVIDKANISRLGYGTFISCIDGVSDGDQISPALVDKTMSCLERNRVVYQLIGVPISADRSNRSETINKFFAERGFPTINVGCAVGCLHSPEEILHIGDLYSSFKAYKSILEDN